MQVKDLIAKLQTLDPELPVALADWQEGRMYPVEEQAEKIAVVTERFYPKDVSGFVVGTFVRIGEE